MIYMVIMGFWSRSEGLMMADDDWENFELIGIEIGHTQIRLFLITRNRATKRSWRS